MVLAAEYDDRDLLTLDERHLRAVRPIGGGSFRLLPVDAEEKARTEVNESEIQ